MSYTTKQLFNKAKEYSELRRWDLSYFRVWKLVEFIYWLDTGNIMPEQTRTDRKASQEEINSMIKQLSDL